MWAGCWPFSLFSVDKDNIIPESVKLAEDGSGDVIVRLYESKKAWTETVFRMDLDAFGVNCLRAAQCDMAEQETEVLSADEGQVALKFGPFEIKTLRLKIRR